MAKIITIGLLDYPGAQQAAILGLEDLFEIVGRHDQPVLKVIRWRGDSECLIPHDGDSYPTALIIPPGKRGAVAADVAKAFAPALRQMHASGTVLASVCVGAFILAESGLLDGRSATTHWGLAAEFHTRFPEVQLNIDRLIIDDGDIITAGGMMAWTDLGLKLVERYFGPVVMMETAHTLLIDPPGREQRYYSSFIPRMDHSDAAVLGVQHWLHASYDRTFALSELAKKAGLEERTFLRRFQKATGMTVTHYQQSFRMDKAREFLQFSADPIETIAWRAGYTDASAFRKVFHKIVGLSPSDYRRRFRPW